MGCSASLTGALSGTKNMVIGYELWRDDVNAAGGLLGRQVELVVYDDQSTPSNVPAIYSKLVDVDKVDFLFTPYGANLTATIMPFAKQRDRFVVGILTLASNDKVRHEKFFQAAPWGADGGTKWATGFFDLAKAQDVKKIAIVAADTEFSKTAAQGGKTVCEQSGIQVVDFQMYPPTNKDFSGILRNIRAAGPDAVFACSYPGDSTAIIRGIQEIGLGDHIKLFGGGMVGPQYASLMEALGPALNGMVNFQLYVPEPTLKFKGIESLLTRYEPIAKEKQVDPLGFYIPPFTYAAGQIIRRRHGLRVGRSGRGLEVAAHQCGRDRGRQDSVRRDRQLDPATRADGAVPGRRRLRARSVPQTGKQVVVSPATIRAAS